LLADPTFLAICLFSVILLGLAKGGFAGLGMAATPLLALIVPPLQAAALLLPILLVQDVISVWAYRRDWDAWNLKVLMPGALIGIGVAWVLAAYLSDAWVRLILGLIGLAFVLNAWFGPRPTEDRQPSAAKGVLWGSLSGVTSVLVQAGSPPFQIFVLPQKLPKLVFVGTNAVFFAAINVVKLAPYYSLGGFSSRTLEASLLLLPLAVAANFLGLWLVRITPQEVFYRISYFLMFCISLALTAEALRTLLR